MATRPILAGGVALACMLFTGTVFAQDARSGRDKARICVVCHGELGIAVAPNAPNLAGENAVYIVNQLKAFREGRRHHDQMTLIAAQLSDTDIADLAEWFSVIKVSATAPQLD